MARAALFLEQYGKLARHWRRFRARRAMLHRRRFCTHRSDRALWNGAERSLPEQSQEKQRAMTASPERGSKVFELLEGGAAARKAGRRKLNVFVRWARAKFYSRSHVITVRVSDKSGALMETHESEGAFGEF